MRPSIIKIKRSTLGTNIVIRSPFSRRWLFNITIAPNRDVLALEWLPGYTVAKAGMALTLLSLIVLTLTGCNATEPETEKHIPIEQREGEVLRFVLDTASRAHSCYFTNGGKDSLKVLGRKYTISDRSRFRSFDAVTDVISAEAYDVWAEGAVFTTPWKAFEDTKENGIRMFASCEIVAQYFGGAK